jgi:V8-like Glu-specific endopeptidase
MIPARTLAAALIGCGLLAPAAFAASELDERRVVAASTTALRAVGLLTGTAGRCTAFLAGGDRVVVTAAHCVLDREGAPAQESFEFQPAYRGGAGAASYRVRVIVAGKWRPPADPATADAAVLEDWAILLADKPTGITPLTLGTALPITQLTDKPLAAVGYADDIQNGRFPTEDPSCQVTRIQDVRIDHSCRGLGGSSGSPIFLRNADGTRGPLVGVVSRGAVTSTAERLVISNLRLVAPAGAIPELDFGGRAVFVGAFVNAVKMASRAPGPVSTAQ